ncbi:MAG: carboxypeptidase regulatory-like domain-containing protein [Ignavibacteria bacterium]|nr:carboxypeptidase regulatory-like domain-containing protein [Ignavibacteria bacterium]
MKNKTGFIIILLISLIPFKNILSFDKSKQTSGYVGGRVIDERNFPVPYAKVIINGQEAETDKAGKFKILNVPFPYDVVIAEKVTATAVVYKGLSIDNPELILFGKPNTRNANSAVINVTFPEIPTGSSAKIKFISADVFYSEDVEVFSGERTKTLLVYWPHTKKNLNGNVVFLQKNNTKYEQYKDKVVSLYKNSIPFKANITEISSNETETSELIVYLPFKDYIVKGYSVFADFQAYNRNSDILLTKEEGNIFRTKSIIPSILPIAYRLKVAGFADYKDGSGFVNYTYSQPGATLNLTVETPPEPQTPTDKFLGANGNTEFYYSLGSGTGIFVLQYHSFYPNMNFYVVTSERSTNLYYLSRAEFKKGVSVEFKWSIKKYLTYFSVNDFVKPLEFNNDIGYKAVLYSFERTFKTGYY